MGHPLLNVRQAYESQPLIPTGARSGLPTHIAATESVSLCVRMKSSRRFLELESAIREDDV